MTITRQSEQHSDATVGRALQFYSRFLLKESEKYISESKATVADKLSSNRAVDECLRGRGSVAREFVARQSGRRW